MHTSHGNDSINAGLMKKKLLFRVIMNIGVDWHDPNIHSQNLLINKHST